MNSKSEWGYYYLPRQITEKRECTAPSEQHNISKSQFPIKSPGNSNEEERSHKVNNIKDSPPAANITDQNSSNCAAHPNSDSQNVTDSFSDQYNQRRKRARLIKTTYVQTQPVSRGSYSNKYPNPTDISARQSDSNITRRFPHVKSVNVTNDNDMSSPSRAHTNISRRISHDMSDILSDKLSDTTHNLDRDKQIVRPGSNMNIIPSCNKSQTNFT